MRELVSSELNQVSGSHFNVDIIFGVPYYPPTPYYSCPIVYEPYFVPYTTVTPIFNQWGQQVGVYVEDGFYEVWEPVYYC